MANKPASKEPHLSKETRAQVVSVNAEAMDRVDERQARGNYLAQLRYVLTEEDQDRAKKEALDYKF